MLDKEKNNLLPAAICFICGVFFAGCASTQKIPAQAANIPPLASLNGIYHRVEKNQTLWQIARIYSIDIDELAKVNKIADPSQIKTGEAIFIPSDTQEKVRQPSEQDAQEDFIWPVKGDVSAGFREKAANTINKGLNIDSKTDVDIFASRSGLIVFADNDLIGYGKTVIIEHPGGFLTVYALMSEILVRPGEQIARGSAIARLRKGTLHFEIRKGYIPQNPYFYLPAKT